MQRQFVQSQIGSLQRGTALIVALVLVLLATVMALFAVNVGVFEQRSSANDVKSKLVEETAETAISQAMAYFKAVPDSRHRDTAIWERCTADDETFPCGAVPKVFNWSYTDPVTGAVTTQTDLPRRSTMYRFIGGSVDVNGDGKVDDMERRMVPINGGKLAAVGNNFDVVYGAGALVCHLQKSDPANIGKPQPTLCSTTAEQDTNTDAMTFVGVGSVPGETARATVAQTIGAYNILNDAPGKPPIVASGSVDVTGTLQVVTNPNSAGPGVPVSVWTRKNMVKNGTPNTCYFDEFIRFGAQNSKPPIYEGSKPQIITCDTCSCVADHSLSYQTSGNTTGEEGIDILDCETCGGATHEGVNYDVKPNEFPCDLFQYLFGVQAYTDQTSPKDYFCETPVAGSYTSAVTGQSYKVARDEQFLYENATKIIPATSTIAGWIEPSRIASCADLNSAAYGLIWDQQGCGIATGGQIGTPDRPVFLVEDGDISIQGRLFGLLFVRTINRTSAGLMNTSFKLDPATGGTATIDMNAGAAIYGALVVQGTVDKANGTSAVIYNADVLNNLQDEDVFNKFGSVPGSWTDRFSF